jgi:hypothetical protein
MIRQKHALLSLILVPALCATVAPSDQITYHPEEGSKLARKFEIKNDFSLDDFAMTMNGQPSPMPMEMTMDMTMTMAIEVTDRLVAVAEGRPGKLHRTFDELSSEGSFSVEMEMMPDGGMEQSVTGSSELEGKTVAFVWNPESSTYDVAYHESEGDSKLLEGLDEDMDLRALLPKGEIEEGGTWEIDSKVFKSIVMPGGDLGIRPEDLDEEAMSMMAGMDGMSNLNEMFGDMFEGEAQGTYQGSEEIDGVRVAKIHVTIDISSSNDVTEMIREAIEGQEMPEGMQFEIDHADVDVAIEGEGTLFWDIAGGYAHSFELSGKMKMEMDSGFSIDMQGQSMDIGQTMAMSGTVSYALSVSRE